MIFKGSLQPQLFYNSTSPVTDAILPTILSILQLWLRFFILMLRLTQNHRSNERHLGPYKKWSSHQGRHFGGTISCVNGKKKSLGTIPVCKTTPSPTEHIYTPTQGKKRVFHGNSWYTYYCRRKEKKHEDERPNQFGASQSCHRVISYSSSGSLPEELQWDKGP